MTPISQWFCARGHEPATRHLTGGASRPVNDQFMQAGNVEIQQLQRRKRHTAAATRGRPQRDLHRSPGGFGSNATFGFGCNQGRFQPETGAGRITETGNGLTQRTGIRTGCRGGRGGLVGLAGRIQLFNRHRTGGWRRRRGRTRCRLVLQMRRARQDIVHIQTGATCQGQTHDGDQNHMFHSRSVTHFTGAFNDRIQLQHLTLDCCHKPPLHRRVAGPSFRV